jgi:hypothetical protein
MRMNKVLVGAVAGGAIKKSLRNITAAQKEGKDQQVIPESEPQVVSATKANSSDEVAKPDTFPAGKRPSIRGSEGREFRLLIRHQPAHGI